MKPIELTKTTRAHLQAAQNYLSDMHNQLRLPHGATIVAGLPGVVCYDTGSPGKTAALMVGTHMNELSGFAAAIDFDDRWKKGERPPSGKVYVIVGGHVPTIKHLLELMLAEPREITEKTFLKYRSKIIKNKEKAGALNHNSLPLRLRDESQAMIGEQALYKRITQIHEILSTCDAGVLDMHSTSQPSTPIASPFTQPGDNDEVAQDKTAVVTKGMPLDFVTLYQEHNLLALKAGDPDYSQTELPLRGFAKVHDGAVSLLVETGQHLDPKSFQNAKDISRAWLQNVMGLPTRSKGATHPRIMKKISKMYHPGAMPPSMAAEYKAKLTAELQDAAKADDVMRDHYFLIHDMRILDKEPAEGCEWSDAAKAAIKTYKEQKSFGAPAAPKTNRLGAYSPIREGDIIAIGLKTGHAVRAAHDGVVFMVNKDPDLAAETGALGYHCAETARARTSSMTAPSGARTH